MTNQNYKSDNKQFKKEFRARLYNWVLRLIKFIDKLPKDSVCTVIGRQLLRSGTSVLANYVEAASASSRKDFINFFTHALKSANESKMWLALLRDTGKSDGTEPKWLPEELSEIANVLASSILTLKGKR
ncbi:MAG: four helix bundle protein [Parcubacteria group bacterium]|nr:four helix bundle protein [Parcubacteria group bacterium]